MPSSAGKKKKSRRDFKRLETDGHVYLDYTCAVLFSVWHLSFLFFFNDTATTEIYTLSLHDALPISHPGAPGVRVALGGQYASQQEAFRALLLVLGLAARSEEHTSELQSREKLV